MSVHDHLEAFRHDGVLWRKLAYLGAAHGPWWWRRYTPRAFGALACATLHRQRGIVARNWQQMRLARTNAEAQRGALRTFAGFAECLTDGLESVGRGLDGYDLESPDDARFVDALKRDRGVLLLTAHTGSWEVVGRLIGRRHRAPVTMVMARETNASARHFADLLRSRPGEGDLEVVYVGEDPLSALAILDALRRRRVVALQFDRVPEGVASIAVPFFDVMQPFPSGPFKLAQVTGAPVVAAFARRIGHRSYAVDIPETIELSRGSGPSSRDAAASVAIARTAVELERFVRRHPAQWFHFEPLSTTPPPQGVGTRASDGV